jgi:hypothetical protein
VRARRALVGVGLGFLALVLLAALLAIPPLRVWLLAGVALVVLIAGGNWLNDFLGIKRKAQEFNRPDRRAPEASGTEDAP